MRYRQRCDINFTVRTTTTTTTLSKATGVGGFRLVSPAEGTCAMAAIHSHPGTRPASLAEPRGDVVQVQRHSVEQLADGALILPALDVPVPQMVDQPVAVLARFDLPIPEQVVEVPKISCPRRFSRTALRSPRMAEQLVEVPLPAMGGAGMGS